MTFYPTNTSYKLAYKMKSQYPTNALYYATRVLGFSCRKTAADAKLLKEKVDHLTEINNKFSFFSLNEWVFDSSSTLKLEEFLSQSTGPEDIKEAKDFAINLKSIRWKDYVMNHAYGVKHYILNEESVLPSMGYNDALTKMD